MKRIFVLLLALLVAGGAAGRALANMWVWNLAQNPPTLVAYRVGGGVMTIASEYLFTCWQSRLVPQPTPFTFHYEIGYPAGVYCPALHYVGIATYYSRGAATAVHVWTKAGELNVPVQPAPPAPAGAVTPLPAPMLTP